MGNKRILIVDKDTPYRQRLGQRFSDRGWSVALAATVDEARARLDPPPRCILLELALGDGPGETVLR
jgi:ActR/RegA family two-component response regulator